MSCAECDRRARYMAADPEMYRDEDTRCDAHQAVHGRLPSEGMSAWQAPCGPPA